MDFTPLGDRILVQAQTGDEVTPGGIIIPENARERPEKGTVIAVGPGPYNMQGDRLPMGVQVGETVVFSRYGGSELTIDGEEFLILREADVLGILVEIPVAF